MRALEMTQSVLEPPLATHPSGHAFHSCHRCVVFLHKWDTIRIAISDLTEKSFGVALGAKHPSSNLHTDSHKLQVADAT